MQSDMLQITAGERDDPQFIEIARTFLQNVTHCYQPDGVYLIQTDNWFDHKWKSFAGVIGLQLGIWRHIRLSLPPFNPHRILRQLYFCRNPKGYQPKEVKPLHLWQSSGANSNQQLQRIVEPPCLLVWYSGGTAIHEQASLMVYFVGMSEDLAWYISFKRHEKWRMNKSEGLSRQEFNWLSQEAI